MMGWQGEGVVLDDEIVRLQFHLVVGTEPKIVVLALGGRIDPPALVAAERTLLVVVGDDVLAKFRSNSFEPVAEMPNEWKISQEGVLPLGQIVDHDDRDYDDRDHADGGKHTGILYLTSRGSGFEAFES